MRLLVTRPMPDAERTAAALRARGHAVLVAPLLRTEFIPDADLGEGPWSGIVLTSANAARALTQHPRRAEIVRWPAYVVGQHTAEAARATGFAQVTSADGDLRDVAKLIGTGRYLHLAAENRAGDLPSNVVVAVIYRAVAARALAPAACDALARGEVGGVLHFSRRSALVYKQCAARAGLTEPALAVVHYCLSSAVADALAGASGLIRIAARPDEAALLELVS